MPRRSNTGKPTNEAREARKQREKEHGGFGWEEGVVLALIGAVTLLNVEKEIGKHEKRHEEEEEQEKRQKERRRGSRDDAPRRLRGSSTWDRDGRYPDRRSRDDRRDDRYYADRGGRRGSW